MKKPIVILLVSILAAAGASAQSAGGGVSVFVPETLYLHGEGTIAFEQGLSTELGFGPFLSLPVGFAYHSTDGYTLKHEDLRSQDGPSLYGDAIIPYAMLKARLPLGPLFLDGFAGGALAWAFSLSPTGRFFPQALAPDGDTRIALSDLSIDKKLGYGWLAGAALGVKFGAVEVDLGATFRSIAIPLDIEAEYAEVHGTSAGAEETRTFKEAEAVLRGISFRLGGSFSF